MDVTPSDHGSVACAASRCSQRSRQHVLRGGGVDVGLRSSDRDRLVSPNQCVERLARIFRARVDARRGVRRFDRVEAALAQQERARFPRAGRRPERSRATRPILRRSRRRAATSGSGAARRSERPGNATVGSRRWSSAVTSPTDSGARSKTSVPRISAAPTYARTGVRRRSNGSDAASGTKRTEKLERGANSSPATTAPRATALRSMPGQVDRDARAAFDAAGRFAEDVDAASARAQAARLQRQRVAGLDRSLHQRAGHDGTDAVERKGAIDRKIDRRSRIARRQFVERLRDTSRAVRRDRGRSRWRPRRTARLRRSCRAALAPYSRMTSCKRSASTRSAFVITTIVLRTFR